MEKLLKKGVKSMCKVCGHITCTGGCPEYEPKIFAVCEKCGENIYDGEEFADLGAFYCKNCLDDMTVKELFSICDLTMETARVVDDYYSSLL